MFGLVVMGKVASLVLSGLPSEKVEVGRDDFRMGLRVHGGYLPWEQVPRQIIK